MQPESPQLTPNKKQKKQSASGSCNYYFLPTPAKGFVVGSPVSRIKAGSDVSGIPASVRCIIAFGGVITD